MRKPGQPNLVEEPQFAVIIRPAAATLSDIVKIGYLMQEGVPDMFHRPVSGPANHVMHVFRELRNQGHEVRILAKLEGVIWESDNLEDYTPISGGWIDRPVVRKCESAVRRIQYELNLPYFALFESIRFALACRQVLAGYDLLYERMGWMGYGGVMAAGQLNVPHVLEVNGDHLSELEMQGMGPSRMQRRLSLMLMKHAVSRVTHVVATGEGWRSQFCARWDIEPECVTVIENGSEIVDLLPRTALKVFAPSVAGSEEITVAYVGGFEPWHGLVILVEAFSNALRRGANLRLLLIGDGTGKAHLESTVSGLELGDRITFTGHLSTIELAQLLAEADIGVSPYCGRTEFSGLKLLDYKGAGLVTVASGQDGEPILVEHGHTGWIVPPCDTEALTGALLHLAGKPDLRRKIGQQARLDAESRHSWCHTAADLDRLFVKILAMRKSPVPLQF